MLCEKLLTGITYFSNDKLKLRETMLIKFGCINEQDCTPRLSISIFVFVQYFA